MELQLVIPYLTTTIIIIYLVNQLLKSS